MPRKKSPTLTEAEYRLMQVLWDRGESSVADVVDAIGDPPLAYNTVLTTMRILEQKGYVRHKAVGRAWANAAIWSQVGCRGMVRPAALNMALL